RAIWDRALPMQAFRRVTIPRGHNDDPNTRFLGLAGRRRSLARQWIRRHFGGGTGNGYHGCQLRAGCPWNSAAGGGRTVDGGHTLLRESPGTVAGPSGARERPPPCRRLPNARSGASGHRRFLLPADDDAAV